MRKVHKKLVWMFSLYAKAPVAMPPDDSLRFTLNVILYIWSSERRKLTESGQFERNSKCKLSSAGIECENIYNMVKSIEFYGHLLGKDLRTCLGCKWCIFWMSQRIAHPSSYVQLFDRWSVSSHTAVSSLLVHCCLVLPHTQDSFRQTMYNGFTATASVSDRDQSMSASLLDLSYFTMLVFILLIHCV